MAELSEIAEWAQRTLTGMPGTSSKVPINLLRAVLDDTGAADEVLAELMAAGRAVRLDSNHYWLKVATQPETDDLAGYGALVMWHAIEAARADRAIDPDGWRLGYVYGHVRQPFSTPASAMSWYQDNSTRLVQLLNGAIKYGLHDVAAELAEPLWALARYAGHGDVEVITQFTTLQCIDAADDETRELRRATALARAADGLSSQGMHDEAVATAETAIRHASTLADAHVLSIAHSARGRAHQLTADFATAIGEYGTALAIEELIGKPRGIALAYLRIASVYCALRKSAVALSLLRTAEELMIESGDAVGRARVLTLRARTLLDDGQHAETYTVVTPIIKVLTAAANDLFLAEAAAVAGEAPEHADLAKATAHYAMAIEKFTAYGNSYRVAEVQRRLNRLTFPPDQ
jgi:tetratricopeptide (TPR) repeat protein